MAKVLKIYTNAENNYLFLAGEFIIKAWEKGQKEPSADIWEVDFIKDNGSMALIYKIYPIDVIRAPIYTTLIQKDL